MKQSVLVIKIEKARANDLPEILSIQKLAFQSEAKLYNRYDISPLIQKLKNIEEEFKNKVFLKAILNGKIVGSVRAWQEEDTCHIERLAIHPDYQNHGFGTKLITKIEHCFANVKRFQLATGYKSVRNIYLYQKLGYKIFKSQEYDNTLKFVYLEKYAKGECK